MISLREIFRFIWKKREAFIWILGLLLMATMDPHQAHGSVCPLNAMGADWCPGCGLGHSIAYLFRGDLSASLHAHFFGIPAMIIILYRIYQIFKPTKPSFNYGTSN